MVPESIHLKAFVLMKLTGEMFVLKGGRFDGGEYSPKQSLQNKVRKSKK